MNQQTTSIRTPENTSPIFYSILDLYQIIISHDWDFLSQTNSTLYKVEHGHIHRCEEDHIACSQPYP